MYFASRIACHQYKHPYCQEKAALVEMLYPQGIERKLEIRKKTGTQMLQITAGPMIGRLMTSHSGTWLGL